MNMFLFSTTITIVLLLFLKFKICNNDNEQHFFLKNNSIVYLKLCDDGNEHNYFNYMNKNDKTEIESGKFIISSKFDKKKKFIKFNEPITLKLHKPSKNCVHTASRDNISLSLLNNFNNETIFYILPFDINEKNAENVNLNTPIFLFAKKKNYNIQLGRSILLDANLPKKQNINLLMTTSVLNTCTLLKVPFNIAHRIDEK